MSMQQIMEMLVEMKATAAADRKADKEESRGSNQELMTRMEAKFDDSQKRAEADKEEILARIKEEDRQANQELLARMDTMFETYKKRMMATKKIEKNPGMMQSVEEHQDVPNEDVAVMPVGEPRKRRRVWKSTARRRGEPKELN
jgi:predicted HAD superfamily phosphohydrolase